MTSQTHTNRNKTTKILYVCEHELLHNPPHASAIRTTTNNTLNPIRSQYQTRNKHLFRFSMFRHKRNLFVTWHNRPPCDQSLTDARSASG